MTAAIAVEDCTASCVVHYSSDPDTEGGYSGNPASSPLFYIPERRSSSRRRRSSSDSSSNTEQERRRTSQISMVALVLTTVRKSVLAASCQAMPPAAGEEEEEDKKNKIVEIGWPTDVQHVAHVTFDRYDGFLGLPEEFQVEVPHHVPSASQSVFGVSADSMQCSFDSKGNSVPTILLLMQERLYSQGGLKAEGIFRINAGNSHEKHVRDQLNKGIVPADIDLHCLAGLIKAWFRELPQGVLDALTPEQVMNCHTEEECMLLVNLLPPSQSALLDWTANLMADVVQEEAHNKMNARNIAMVFAPNMTQMADPLTALMHAVQVMNFLKTLVLRVLRYRQEAILEKEEGSGGNNGGPSSGPETPDEGDDEEVASSDCNGMLLNGHKRHSSGIQVDSDEFSHCMIFPTKWKVVKVKTKTTGKLMSILDKQQLTERAEAW
ncbi:unnamed protein product [Sphagnum troendelagicum]|uniref:Rho GTPase activating protein n=1 Tax=Sphagnum troendelagicum TaxID=128251 RepID=A0ABP0TI30_9BRYO